MLKEYVSATVDRLPHMRGDEPYEYEDEEGDDIVCPTCVGMNRC